MGRSQQDSGIGKLELEPVDAYLALIPRAIRDTVGFYDIHSGFDWEDYRSIATVAILESMPKWDGTAKFSTYVWKRIRGAILDAVRRDTWNPLSFRRDLDGDPRRRGFLARVDLPMESVPCISQDPNDGLFDTVETMLDGRSFRIIEAIYIEGRTERQIAFELGISWSRVNVLHHRILRKLRFKLKEHHATM